MHLTREEKHGYSANSVTEHSPFLLLSEKEAEGEEEKALIKGRRMRGGLEESIRLPVSGPLLDGMAWLLPPAGLSSRCLHGSATLIHNSRGGRVKPGKRREPCIYCEQQPVM